MNIIDSYGRVHDYLRISLTERCNLRCFYCMPEEGIVLREKEEFMTAEETIFLAKTFVDLGVKKIRLTGGEPLIKKNIDVILKGLSALPVELGITTNGILLDKHLELLKETGVRSVNVSLDTLNRDKFKKITFRDYFDRVYSNIELLISEGFKVKVNNVVIRGVNEDEILDFVALTKDWPVQVRFIEFMPFDGNKWNWDKKISQKEILSQIHSFYSSDQLMILDPRPNDTTKNYQLKGYQGTIGIISSVTNPFCDTCNRIRLTADGKIKNCLFSQDESDLLSGLRNGEDLRSKIQKAIWLKKKARGGIESFDNDSFTPSSHLNRNMVTIGG